MFTIYNLSCLCMLTANGIFFFFGQVCLRLALEVQYLVDRFGVHQTTVSRTFNFLSVLSLILPKTQLTFYFLLRPFRSPFAQPYSTAFFIFLGVVTRRSFVHFVIC